MATEGVLHHMHLLGNSTRRSVAKIVARARERERESSITKLGKGGKDSEERSKATRSEGDELEDSAARALMRHHRKGWERSRA